MDIPAKDIRRFELYWRFGISALLFKSGYEGTKTEVEQNFPGHTFEEMIEIARQEWRPKKDKKEVCSYCNIRQDFPDSLEGEAVKLLSRDLGIRIFRTKYGKYYTAREERVAGGKEYFEHAWIDFCPKCGRRLG